MIEIALMIEGQDGLTWPRWQRIARVAEDSGFVGLYRSDHFTNPVGPYVDSLECWISLAWLASHSSRIQFGPIVSPISFRHPAMLVRQAAAISDLSAGRLQFGIGAGWMEREHVNYSYPLGDVPTRMARFREAVEVMAHLLRTDEPLTFEGEHYQLREAVLLPRPKHHVPIVIGGSGRQVTLPLVARWADEWNCGPGTVAACTEGNAYLDALLDKAGRDRRSVKRSKMSFVRYGRDQADVEARLARQPIPPSTVAGTVKGTAEQIRDYCAELEAAGFNRVMLNWRDDYDDVDGMAHLGHALFS